MERQRINIKKRVKYHKKEKEMSITIEKTFDQYGDNVLMFETVK